MRMEIYVKDKTGNKIYCKVVITRLEAQEPYPEQAVEQITGQKPQEDGFKSATPSIIENFYCGGYCELELEKGRYKVEVYRGKLYFPFRQLVDLNDKDISLEVSPEEVLDIKSLGLYSFDAHSHVSRDEVLDTGDLISASDVMKGEDFNFLFAGSPYDHKVHLQYLNKNFTDVVPYRDKFAEVIRKVSNESYILDIGNELVKCRYGHAFMMNYEQKPPFSKYYDEEWDPWLFTKIGKEPAYKISYMHEALAYERGGNSIAAVAHPTSWWWHDNGEFVTNIAATIGFEILAGSIDAMVVMGYERDHKYYQELWFEALKNGYFLPGIAETDASFDRPPARFLEFKSYAIIDDFNIDSLCRSVREGKCIVSSGPIVMMKIDGQFPGSVLPWSAGDKFNLEIYAHRCWQSQLSKIQIITNGRIYKEYDIKQNIYNSSEKIEINEDCFILVKCYDSEGNLGMTNPVYIRNKPFLNRGYLSRVNINVYKNGKSVKGAYRLDESNEWLYFDGNISLSMRIASKLYVEVNGKVKTIRLFELPELQEIFRNLYFGKFNSDRRYNPGEVPAAEFKLSYIRSILDNVKMDLNF